MKNKPLKILFYSHQANLAGAPLSVAGLINHLPKEYSSIWVCPEQGPVMKIIHAPKIVIGKWFQERKLIDLIKNHDIDVVHANTLFAWPAVAAANATNVPVIWHIREDLDLFPKSLTQKVEKHADHIILISNWMKKFFKSSPKVSVIYNGIDIQPVKAKLSPIPLFVTLGTIEPRKGIHSLIAAAAQLKKQNLKFKIHIYGKPLSTTRGYFRKLKKTIKKEGLESFVEFKGVTGNIAKAIAPAWAVVIPSLSEPFGRTAVETMALKKPVIASRVGGLSEIVVPGKTGWLVKPHDGQALAGAMNQLKPQMGQAGFKRYRKLFTQKKHVEQVTKLYQRYFTR